MKILWLIGFSSHKSKSYGGGGWIRSLASKLAERSDIELTLAYIYDEDKKPFVYDGYIKHPIFRRKTILQKIKYNLFSGYRDRYEEKYLSYVLEAINEIKPDLIQVFGIENVCAPIIGNTDIPTVLYIQGLLNPIYNSYYPVNMSDFTARCIGGIKREWIFNNGFVKRHLGLAKIAKRESELYSKIKYVIGRTNYDYQVSRLYAPQSKYFKLNEMMRSTFYVENPWEKKHRGTYYVFSTLSGVTYKGFDVILKAAKLLKEQNINFEWRIAGLNEKHSIVKFFEKFTGIKSDIVNVRYLGVLSEDQLKDALLDSDVMVHPSYVDNSPNSVCEAQLLGLPVIATYVGGIPDFVKNEVTGITVPLNAPYEIAFRIMEDIREPYMYKFSEPSRREALERHEPSVIVNDIIKIYKSILNEGNSCTADCI